MKHFTWVFDLNGIETVAIQLTMRLLVTPGDRKSWSRSNVMWSDDNRMTVSKPEFIYALVLISSHEICVIKLLLKGITKIWILRALGPLKVW